MLQRLADALQYAISYLVDRQVLWVTASADNVRSTVIMLDVLIVGILALLTFGAAREQGVAKLMLIGGTILTLVLIIIIGA